MSKHLPWTLGLALLCAAPGCVLQTESVPAPSGWDEVDEGITYVDGYVGIGTLAPLYPLEVQGYMKAKGYFVTDTAFVASNGSESLALYTGSAPRLTVKPEGGVWIPDSPTAGNDLQVDGQAAITTLYLAGVCTGSCPSDGRLKTNVEPVVGALDRLLQLRGVTYEWKDQEARGARERGAQTGFIAQEVEVAFPEWVTEGPDGYRRLQIRGFEALAVEALRSLDDRSRALAARVAALEETNARLVADARGAREEAARVTELAADLASERRAREKLEARLATLEAERRARAHLEARLAALEAAAPRAPARTQR